MDLKTAISDFLDAVAALKGAGGGELIPKLLAVQTGTAPSATPRTSTSAPAASIRKPGPAPKPKKGTRQAGPVTRWVADQNARRVPNFVLEATGLPNKKAIVAKYGAGAIFENGKPLPSARNSVKGETEPEVTEQKQESLKAKAPTRRRPKAQVA